MLCCDSESDSCVTARGDCDSECDGCDGEYGWVVMVVIVSMMVVIVSVKSCVTECGWVVMVSVTVYNREDDGCESECDGCESECDGCESECDVAVRVSVM